MSEKKLPLKSNRRTITQNMATKMVDLTRSYGAATNNDLLRHGFTPDQINDHGEAAQIAAGKMMTPADRQAAA